MVQYLISYRGLNSFVNFIQMAVKTKGIRNAKKIGDTFQESKEKLADFTLFYGLQFGLDSITPPLTEINFPKWVTFFG